MGDGGVHSLLMEGFEGVGITSVGEGPIAVPGERVGQSFGEGSLGSKAQMEFGSVGGGDGFGGKALGELG